MKTMDAHCPICGQPIDLPIWLIKQFGDRYAAYCEICQRAYTANEVYWSSAATRLADMPTRVLAWKIRNRDGEIVCRLPN